MEWTRPKVVRMKLSVRRQEQLIRVLMRQKDPRKRRGIRHQSTCILGIAVCAVLSGAKSYEAIAQWARMLEQAQRRRFDCRVNPRTGARDVPSEKAFRDFLQSIDAGEIDRSLGQWFQDLLRNEPSAIAIDGKSLRGSGSEGKQIQLLSAVLHGTGVTVGQRQVDSKSNEIPEAPKLLRELDLAGKVVTGDALHTQTELAKFIVEEKKADYVLTVKGNQPTLKKDIEDLFEGVSIPPSA
jgi:hypothetical protein